MHEIPIVNNFQKHLNLMLRKRLQQSIEILSTNYQKLKVGIFKIIIGGVIL
jgi:hypothetical protein